MAVTKLKKRQGSKKNKKAWRKTDIKDVEDFLEDKRLEERLGTPFSKRQDNELFTIDTVPDETNLDKYEDLMKDRRKNILSRPPRCFQVLQSDSKVPDPISKRNRIRSAEERKHPLLRLKESQRLENGILKAKELDRIKNRIVDQERRNNKPVRGDFSKDLWNDASFLSPEIPEINSEWVEPTTQKHILACLSSRQKMVPSKVSGKPHVIPAVEVPHPGTSYNPSYTDHLDLLQKIAETEQKLIKEEQHIRRVTTLMFKKLPQGEAEAQWIKEMSEGVPTLDPEASKPDLDVTADNEYRAINPPTTRDKKKNLKTRRKAREEKTMQAARHLSKIEQKKISDIYRLKKLEEALAKAEEKSRILKEKRQAIKARRATKTKRLGRNKFEEKEMEFNLASELKGSLRSLKPEGNLLADRFISFQKRNIMEVAARQNPRSAKKKKFVKASHKMAWEVHPLQKPSHQRKKLQASTKALGQK